MKQIGSVALNNYESNRIENVRGFSVDTSTKRNWRGGIVIYSLDEAIDPEDGLAEDYNLREITSYFVR
ncbi:hypothetical protein CMI38_02915 [Candidatus Pacearchaeota archaeon]|jgi:hypothetical protein|nr:hypothetical protein [Candidatus Pacearchaeota archaeon]|tara:strand:- start:74 stop:277 length:204 start_codon:yes stop_codon:yes gene_type:complete